MSESIITKTYPVKGLSCAGCATNVEKRLRAQQGVESVAVNFSNSSAYINFNSQTTNPELLKKEIQALGYDLIIDEDSSDNQAADEKSRFNELKRKLTVAAVLTIPIFLISMFWHNMPLWMNYILFVLTSPVVFYAGAEFYRIAWKQALNRMANMDTLVAIGTGVAYAFSVFNTFFPQVLMSRGMDAHVYYEASAVIITFILAGRFLEEKSKSKASSAIKKLMGLQPKTLTVIANGQEKNIPVQAVNKNDIVVLKPGDKVPVDGIVTKGESLIDESMISGEPLPVQKSAGNKIFAGTINHQGLLYIKATRVGSETLLSQIITLVEHAQASKPPVQKLVDKIASVFVPVVMALAVLTFLIWFLVGPEPSLTYAFITTISILIIACPCALGLATPTALIAGIGRGAESGILIKDAKSLELACKTQMLVLDKTGTLTEGKPKVVDFWYQNDDLASDILLKLGSVVKQSTHPLSAALLEFTAGKTDSFAELKSFTNVSGKGIKAVLDGKSLFAGSAAFLREEKINFTETIETKLAEWAEQGSSLVLFSDDVNVLAAFALTDPVKPDAADAVQEIRNLGIDVMLLTGDNEASASQVASITGITSWKANCMPADKNEFIADLQKKGQVVAMAGDGINDAAALAQADLGIAMGSGADIAMESAGITLMNSDPLSIARAIKLSKFTVKVIRQNLFWAFIYNIIAIPVAAGLLFPFTGMLLNPMIAGAAMAFSSVAVVANSLRLRKFA